MRIKMLTGIAGEHFSCLPGEIVTIDDERAKRWIERKIAERAPEDTTVDLAGWRAEVDAKFAALSAEIAIPRTELATARQTSAAGRSRGR